GLGGGELLLGGLDRGAAGGGLLLAAAELLLGGGQLLLRGGDGGGREHVAGGLELGALRLQLLPGGGEGGLPGLQLRALGGELLAARLELGPAGLELGPAGGDLVEAAVELLLGGERVGRADDAVEGGPLLGDGGDRLALLVGEAVLGREGHRADAGGGLGDLRLQLVEDLLEAAAGDGELVAQRLAERGGAGGDERDDHEPGDDGRPAVLGAPASETVEESCHSGSFRVVVGRDVRSGGGPAPAGLGV